MDLLSNNLKFYLSVGNIDMSGTGWSGAWAGSCIPNEIALVNSMQIEKVTHPRRPTKSCSLTNCYAIYIEYRFPADIKITFHF